MARSQDDRSAGDWHDQFIDALSKTGNVRAALSLCNDAVNRTHAYDTKKINEEFSQRWDNAILDWHDRLEQEASRRAMSGSDRLLEKLLEGALPGKYGRRQRISHEGHAAGGPVEVTFQIAPESGDDDDGEDTERRPDEK